MTKFFVTAAFAISMVASPVLAQDVTADTAPVISVEEANALLGLNKGAIIAGGLVILATGVIIAVIASDDDNATATN